MTVEKIVNGGDAVVKIFGRIDTITAPELEQELTSVLEEANTLELDFTEVEYVSSAGLRVILNAQKSMAKKGGMKLTHVNDAIMEVFELTCFTDFLTIE